MTTVTQRKSPYVTLPYWQYLLSLSLLLLAVLLASIVFGSYTVSPAQLLQTLFAQAPSESIHLVVWELRLPRAFVAAISGALFALSGAVLQHVTRNPLADPSLVGVSQGASLAMVTTLILLPEMPYGWRPVIALVGALLTAAIIQAIAMRRGDTATLRFILTGVGVAALISALIAAMLTYGRIDRAQSALAWLSGSVYGADWLDVWLLLILLTASLPILWWFAPVIGVLRIGADIATGLGVNAAKSQWLLIALSVMLAASAVSVVGPLTFIGLIAPHAARRLCAGSVGVHLLLSALIGALLVCGADLLGRTVVAPFQIPAGLVTVVIGVPCFVFFMLRKAYQEAI